MSIRKSSGKRSSKTSKSKFTRRSRKLTYPKFDAERFVKKNKKIFNQFRMDMFNRGLIWDGKGNMKRRNRADVVTSSTQLPKDANPILSKDKKKLNPAILAGVLGGILVVGSALWYVFMRDTNALDIESFLEVAPPTIYDFVESDNLSTNASGGTSNPIYSSGAVIRNVLLDYGVQVTDTISDFQLSSVFANESLSDEARLEFATLKEGEFVVDEYTDFRIKNNLFGE